MKRHLLSALALLSIIFATSCAYTNVRSPLDTNLQNTDLGTKSGTASNYSLLWLFAWGDGSYAKAAKNGDIKVMKHADQQFQQYFFGMYVKQTTIVYGD